MNAKYDPSLPEPPQEIINAAHKIENWMTQNGYCDYWELGPVCSRKFAEQVHNREAWDRELAKLYAMAYGYSRH